MAKAPLLDLSTLIERPTIAIDGTSYELRTPDELSILDSHWLTTAGKAIEEIATMQGDCEELRAKVTAVVKKVVIDLPPEVLGKLSDAMRLAIVEVFTGLLARRRSHMAGAVARAILAAERLETGGGIFRGSSGSTAATPTTGSATSPAAS